VNLVQGLSKPKGTDMNILLAWIVGVVFTAVVIGMFRDLEENYGAGWIAAFLWPVTILAALVYGLNKIWR